MSYNAFFSLDSVKVIRSDGEDGEYSFRVYYKNTLYSIVNTPDNVEDGSEWRPNAVAYQIGPFADNENFTLKLESTEHDGGFRFGDGNATIEKKFSINEGGLHRVYMKDDDDNEVEFRIMISIQYINGGIGGNQQPPLNTESNLLGVMLYEDWHYNKEVVQPVSIFDRIRSQRIDVGDYDLPYEPSFSTGGRWGAIGRVLGVRPNTISSLKVGTDYYIELYDGFGQKGNKIALNENTPEMPSSWNDKVKSISIKKRQQPR